MRSEDMQFSKLVGHNAACVVEFIYGNGWKNNGLEDGRQVFVHDDIKDVLRMSVDVMFRMSLNDTLVPSDAVCTELEVCIF